MDKSCKCRLMFKHLIQFLWVLNDMQSQSNISRWQMRTVMSMFNAALKMVHYKSRNIREENKDMIALILIKPPMVTHLARY